MVSAEKSWLEERLKLDGEEVEAAMWLSPVLARLVAEAEIPVNCPSQLEVTLLHTTGQQSRVNINPRVLTNMVSLLASLYPDYTKTTAITGTGAGRRYRESQHRNKIRTRPVASVQSDIKICTFQSARMVYQHVIDIFKTILKSDSDEDLGDKLLLGAYIYLTVVFVQSYFFPAPYGKFTTSSVSLIDRLRKIEFPARISWLVMEIPSFLVSLSALLHLASSG